jgi:hypothetical protein
MGTTLMLASRRDGGFSKTDRSLPGKTSDDIEVVADEPNTLQRHARELVEIALGLVALRSASGAASQHATT